MKASRPWRAGRSIPSPKPSDRRYNLPCRPTPRPSCSRAGPLFYLRPIVTSLSFSTLPLARAVLDNLDTLGYQSMTPVQAQALPQVLDGRDLIVQAKTGSGKTAAFGLGIVHRLDPSLFAIQAL